MKRLLDRMNPFARGILAIGLVAVLVIVLQLYTTLVVVTTLLRLGFILALVFFVYLMWRERRGEIAAWSLRARTCFYGAALLIVADVGAEWYRGARGTQILAFLAVIVICGFAMWRVWRDQNTFS